MSRTRPIERPDKPRAVPLSRLREGERARLHTANLRCEDCELLQAMGLTEHCEIRVCQSGEPCIVQVHATRLGLSAALARHIMVSPIVEPA